MRTPEESLATQDTLRQPSAQAPAHGGNYGNEI